MPSETDLDQSHRLLDALAELIAADFSALERLRGALDAEHPAVSEGDIEGMRDALPALVRSGAVSISSGYGSLLYRPSPLGLRLLDS